MFAAARNAFPVEPAALGIPRKEWLPRVASNW